jgi:protein phosphatase
MSDSRNDGLGGRAREDGSSESSPAEVRGTGATMSEAIAAVTKLVSPSSPASSGASPAAASSPEPGESTAAAGEVQPARAMPTLNIGGTDLPAAVAPDGGESAALPGTTESSAPGPEPTRKADGAPVPTIATEGAQSAPDGVVVSYYGLTDVGLLREHNEDNFLVADLTAQRRGVDGAIVKTTLGVRGLVLAVCDGMGGAAAGEVASQMAVDTIYEVLQAARPPPDRDAFARSLVRAIEEAGARIFAAAKMDRNRRGMGTTATVAGLVDEILFVGQVGDSRAYVLRGDQLALITKDQSLVNQLIEAGQLTEEEAQAFEHSNIILQALGTTEDVTVDLTFLELRRGDRLLLCSDGLSGMVHDEMIREVLKGTRDLSEAAQKLIAMANASGGHDNITAVLAEFDGSGLREATPDARVAYQQYPLPPEEPSGESAGASAASGMKPGGPNPGAGVTPELSRDNSRVSESPGTSWLWLLGVAALIALIVIAGIVVWADAGERSGAPESDTTRVTIATPVTPPSSEPAPEPAKGRILVRTDAAHGVLYVNGERWLGAVEDRMELALPPGAYRFELRDGDVRIAEATVTLAAGERATIELTMPEGELPERPPSQPRPAMGETTRPDEEDDGVIEPWHARPETNRVSAAVQTGARGDEPARGTGSSRATTGVGGGGRGGRGGTHAGSATPATGELPANPF